MCRKKLYREYDEKGTLIKKECCKCGKIKSADNFSKHKGCKDGYNGECKECHSIYRKNYYLKNKDKELEKQHQYYQENKQKIYNQQHQYYQENNQKILSYRNEYHRQYVKNNKEKINKYQKQYYEENKEKIAKHKSQYRKNNKEKIVEYKRQYNKNNKEKINKYQRQYYQNNLYKEILQIYENVTKNLYPNNGIQYGIIYGVHCKVSGKWYIGQTIKTFNFRYHGDFFNYKTIELSNDSIKGKLLQDDIEKYGQESFEIFEVIDVAFSEKELDEKECYYIDLYKAYDEGYNSNRGNIFKHNKSKRKDVI